MHIAGDCFDALTDVDARTCKALTITEASLPVHESRSGTADNELRQPPFDT